MKKIKRLPSTNSMTDEIIPTIRNKLTTPRVALEKLAKGEKIPKEF